MNFFDFVYDLATTPFKTSREVWSGMYGVNRRLRSIFEDIAFGIVTVDSVYDSVIAASQKFNKRNSQLTPEKQKYTDLLIRYVSEKMSPDSQIQLMEKICASPSWGVLRAHVSHSWASQFVNAIYQQNSDKKTLSVENHELGKLSAAMKIFTASQKTEKVTADDEQVLRRFVQIAQACLANKPTSGAAEIAINKKSADGRTLLTDMESDDVLQFHKAALDIRYAIFKSAQQRDFVKAAQTFKDYQVSCKLFNTRYSGYRVESSDNELFDIDKNSALLDKSPILLSSSHSDERKKMVDAITGFYFSGGIYFIPQSPGYKTGVNKLLEFVEQEKAVMGKSWSVDASAAKSALTTVVSGIESYGNNLDKETLDLLQKTKLLGFVPIKIETKKTNEKPLVAPPVTAKEETTPQTVTLDVPLASNMPPISGLGTGAQLGKTVLGKQTDLSVYTAQIDQMHAAAMEGKPIQAANVLSLFRGINGRIEDLTPPDRLKMAQVIAATAIANGELTVQIGRNVINGIRALDLDLSNRDTMKSVFALNIQAAVKGGITEDAALATLSARMTNPLDIAAKKLVRQNA